MNAALDRRHVLILYCESQLQNETPENRQRKQDTGYGTTRNHQRKPDARKHRQRKRKPFLVTARDSGSIIPATKGNFTVGRSY